MHRTTRQVALIIDASKPYDRKVIRGVGAYCREVGNWSLYVEEDPVQKLPDLRSWQGHGIIANLDDPRVAAAIRGLTIPVVGVGGGFGHYDPRRAIPYFATDSVAIARLAAEHLIQRGFPRLAYCGVPLTRTNGWSRIRAEAFAACGKASGLPCWTFSGRYGTARHWQRLQEELRVWIEELPKPIGLLACNDARARHVLEACRALGVRVPEDLALIGVDNDETICELTDPPLSSVDQGAHRLGYQAAALLDRMMRGRHVRPKCCYVQPEQVVTRRSSDVLAIEDPDVANAMRFIHDRACEGIRVHEIVQAVGLSRSTLERKFKETLGCTLHDQIRRFRLARAQQLLREGEFTLRQIAKRTAFRHLSYSNRFFRQATGQTPAAYRRSVR